MVNKLQEESNRKIANIETAQHIIYVTQHLHCTHT